MASKDPFKLSDDQYDQFVNELVTQSTAKKVPWGIPQPAIDTTTAPLARWNAGWLAAKDPDDRTRAQVLEKDDARKALSLVLRPFGQQWIVRNSLVTDTERLALRYKPRDTTKTRVPVPTTTPIIDPKAGSGNMLLFHFRQEAAVPGTQSRGKPEGVDRCEFALKIGDPAPKTIDECPIRKPAKRTPLRMTFGPEQAGLRVHGFAWWVNTRSEAGPPTPAPFSGIIPG